LPSTWEALGSTLGTKQNKRKKNKESWWSKHQGDTESKLVELDLEMVNVQIETLARENGGG
jgi:hypothetical protein